jgi:maleylpyruvate isomerase
MVTDTGKPDGPGAAREHRMDNEVLRSMARIGEATDRLVASAATLTDAQMREPSLLPGWTRGHVLTHVARNADGLGNLLRGARTSTEIPMYASRESRQADIEAGAGRPGAELTADVQGTAITFAAEAASLPGDSWTVRVAMLTGPAFPARGVLNWRLGEVEIHHVDLATGYRPADWPGEFVTDSLPEIAGSFGGREDTPSCLLHPDGGNFGLLQIGPVGPVGPVGQPTTPRVLVSGPPADLLAWLLGRDDGSGLRVAGDDAVLPVLPRWR